MGVAGVMLRWGSGRRGVGPAGFLPAVGGLGGWVQNREFSVCALRLWRFILMIIFSDTLLVVSILGIL